MKTKLYEFKANFGRMGSLNGRFFLDEEIEALLPELYGKSIDFGEVLGKHSEVVFDLKPEHLKLVTDDQAFLAKAEELGISLAHGYDPISRYFEALEEREGNSRWTLK